MKVMMIGCGRWGSLIAWYLSTLSHEVTLYGRESSANMQRFLRERKNDLLTLPPSVTLTTELAAAKDAEVILISVPAQSLRALLREPTLRALRDKTFVLCMKGIEVETGMRLSQVTAAEADRSNHIAVWLGPGHVQDFYAGIPNCMVIDSDEDAVKCRLIDAFSGKLIRFYYGDDMIGNEIGAAAKNVIGIAAGVLDGLGLSTLKGALMSRGTREVARLIAAMGGNERSAYGLCHLGDYEATLFSPYSHNRAYGEGLITGAPMTKLAEGHPTAAALHKLAAENGVEMPIVSAVYSILYEGAAPKEAINRLFERRQGQEF